MISLLRACWRALVTRATASARSSGSGRMFAVVVVSVLSHPYTYSIVNNQLTSTAGPVAEQFQYDAAGNLQATTHKSFAYDARHRLVQASFGAGSASYQLNALGQRVLKSTGSGIATVYHYDSAGRLIAESDAQGNVQVEYIRLGDMPVAVIQ